MKRITYGYSEIARASRKSAGAVRVDAQRKRFDPENLYSVSVYVVTARLKQEKDDG